jgi:hypothetical protein
LLQTPCIRCRWSGNSPQITPITGTGFRANLIQEQLDQAEGDENTKLPSFLKPPEHWSGKTDEQPEES